MVLVILCSDLVMRTLIVGWTLLETIADSNACGPMGLITTSLTGLSAENYNMSKSGYWEGLICRPNNANKEQIRPYVGQDGRNQ